MRPGNFITLPNQSVDTNGNITVPYAGAIRPKGRTVVQVQQAIVNALKNRALEPQAVVALVEQRASSISVLGEVDTPSRFPASASGERLLDAITRAGGPKNPGYDTWVMLERDGRQATAPFGRSSIEPANNIYVRPQDTIYVFTQPQTFVAFGASGQQGQFPFGAWRLSLAEAVAKAGGLNDNLADPASVFVYRGEPREVAEQLGIDCARFSGPDRSGHLQSQFARSCRLLPRHEIRDAEQGRHLRVQRAFGRRDQVPDVSADDHRHGQRSDGGWRQRLHLEEPRGRQHEHRHGGEHGEHLYALMTTVRLAGGVVQRQCAVEHDADRVD